MPQTIEDLTERLLAVTRTGARARLVARGLARGMVWRDGVVPTGAPTFATSLSADLLDHGYSVLDQALRLKDLGGRVDIIEQALRVAAESLEAAARKGAAEPAREFHLVAAAAAFHTAGYGARAFCLVPQGHERGNVSTPERMLAALIKRQLRSLRIECVQWLANGRHQDAFLAEALRGNDDTTVDDVEQIALTGNFVSAMGSFLSAQQRGDAAAAEGCRERLFEGSQASALRGYVSLWWANTLASHLTSDLWRTSLHSVLPAEVVGEGREAWSQWRQRFIAVLRSRPNAEIDLWPSQLEAAVRAVDPDDDLVVALPTSAGKTRIAELCILRCLAEEKRVVYVTPLRALSAQVEKTLAKTFRPLGVSTTALYGSSGVAVTDIRTLRGATIVVATPEKLDFAIRVDPSVIDDVGLIVLDEGHMIGLGEREIRYEVLVQRLLRRPDAGSRRIACLSAVFSAGDAFDDFTAWIRSDEAGSPVVSSWRPTRQRTGLLTWRDGAGMLSLEVDGERPYIKTFVPSEQPRGMRRKPFPKDEEELTLAAAKAFMTDGHRVLVYCPLRRSVEKVGETLLRLNRQGHFNGAPPAADDISRALHVGREWLGSDHVALRTLRLGVGLHHAALPRAFLSEIEDLLVEKKLPLVVASPTLAQGLDLSCSVLIFRSIYRSGNVIPAHEFANVKGRAGRAFVDLDGITVYPIFADRRTSSWKERQYRQLERDAAERVLESGLVQLIERLIEIIASRLGVPSVALRDLTADAAFDWTEGRVDLVRVTPGEEDEEARPEEQAILEERKLRDLLASLDTAILGSVANLDTPVEELADALDQALDQSLWRRRLARRAEEDAATSRDMLVRRAQWVWRRTQTAERRGYFNAGIGYSTGRFLTDNIAELIASLLRLELGLGRGEVEVDALVSLAQRVSTVAPFRFQFASGNWENGLRSWVEGQPLGEIMTEGGDEVAFIQNDVVFRMVWAVEAIRVYALALDVQGVRAITGRAAMALTYGVPSQSAAILAQAGLPSRRLIMRLVRDFPPGLDSTDGIPDWVERVQTELPAAYWTPEPLDAMLWAAFARRSTLPFRGAWEERIEDADVDWNEQELAQPVGSRLEVVHDPIAEVTHVCSAELLPMGRLTRPLTPSRAAYVVDANVVADRRIRLRFFGPQTRG